MVHVADRAARAVEGFDRLFLLFGVAVHDAEIGQQVGVGRMQLDRTGVGLNRLLGLVGVEVEVAEPDPCLIIVRLAGDRAFELGDGVGLFLRDLLGGLFSRRRRRAVPLIL